MPKPEKISYVSRHDRMVACDSDGCVFDVMDLKHKECFCPAFIKHFQLQRCARQAREIWEFVNLFSRTRGSNRFLAVGIALKILAKHPEVIARKVEFMDFSRLHDFLDITPVLGDPTLVRAIDETRDPALQAMLAWTHEVNLAVAAMCRGLGPFTGSREGLHAAGRVADVVVVSQAPRETLVNEWTHAGLSDGTVFIAGQEFGSKTAQIQQAMEGHYPAEHVLVLGDAPGDQEAAEAVGARFFPINPGDEPASWENFIKEGLPRLKHGAFDTAYQKKLINLFSAVLPSTPPWLR